MQYALGIPLSTLRNPRNSLIQSRAIFRCLQTFGFHDSNGLFDKINFWSPTPSSNFDRCSLGEHTFGKSGYRVTTQSASRMTGNSQIGQEFDTKFEFRQAHQVLTS